MVHVNFIGLRQVFGIVANATTKLRLGPMISRLTNCKAQIEISFKAQNLSQSRLLARSISASIVVDTKVYDLASASETKVAILNNDNSSISLKLETSEVPRLRAAINSYLRLINTSSKICRI